MRLKRIMQRSLIVNVILILMKLITGFVFRSTALIADGVHSISDMLSDLFVIIGINHSFKPADDDHPFGHGKFEYILSLFLGMSIIIIAFNLAKQVIVNFSDPVVIPSALSLIVVVVVVVVKLILARYLINQGKQQNSEIIKASGMESFSDVLSSAIVFVGLGFVYLGQYLDIYWLQLGDRIASILIALFIIRIGIIIIYEAVHSLQGKSVDEQICKVYKDIAETVEGVIRVDHIDMVSYGPYYQAIVDIAVKKDLTVKKGHDIAETVYDRLKEEEKICHVSVHVNPGGPNE
jgi:cation diffusion facilitator family transporter